MATTHSPRLKGLSYHSPDVDCAAVLLDGDDDDGGGVARRPSFRLSYGIIGESHALAAASRCRPSLPASVLARASELTTAGSDDEGAGSHGHYLRALAISTKEEGRRARRAREAAERDGLAAVTCRNAMMALAAAYDDHLARQELRLEECYAALKRGGDGEMELVGDTLAELRVVKKKVKSQQELLRDKGLKAMPSSYSLRPGESVVILTKGEWEGATVEVVDTADTDDRLRPTEVSVKLASSWDTMFDANLNSGAVGTADRPFVVQRHELAIWDYGGAWDGRDDVSAPVATSVPDARRRLQDLLSTLKTEPRAGVEASTFTSSRQRKAAKGKKRKGK